MADRSPDLRCSDTDRDRVAGELREHYAEGRITLEEFDERTTAVYAAKTFGDLAPLTADLPVRAPDPPARQPEGPSARTGKGPDARLVAMWTPWLLTTVICVVIWLLSMIGSGDWTYPWPVWVAGPWGVILFVATLGGAGSQKRYLDRRDRERVRAGLPPHRAVAMEARRERTRQRREHRRRRYGR